MPSDVASTLKWMPTTLDQSGCCRNLTVCGRHGPIASKLNGETSAATVTNRKRQCCTTFSSLPSRKSSSRLTRCRFSSGRHRSRARGGPRSCGQPDTSRTLLQAVREVKRSGNGCPPATRAPTTRHSVLRRQSTCDGQRDHPGSRAESGDGKMEPPRTIGASSARRSAPHAGKDWTNNGTNATTGDSSTVRTERSGGCRFRRHLRRSLRSPGQVPADGERRLFYGERGGEIPVITTAACGTGHARPRSPKTCWRRPLLPPLHAAARRSVDVAQRCVPAPKWRPGPGTRSRCCSRSMPSACTGRTWSPAAHGDASARCRTSARIRHKHPQ